MKKRKKKGFLPQNLNVKWTPSGVKGFLRVGWKCVRCYRPPRHFLYLTVKCDINLSLF